MRELRYNPDQPRDSHGRFGTGDASYDKNNEDLKQTIEAWQDSDSPAEGLHPDDEFISSYKQTCNDAAAAAKAGGQAAKDDPIVNGIRNEEFAGTIYRGLTINKTDEMAHWKERQTVQLMPTSFSKSQAIAEDFAIRDIGQPGGMPKEIPVIIHLTGGGAGIELGTRGNASFAAEKEVISGGKFKVVGILPYGGIYHITLKQTGVF